MKKLTKIVICLSALLLVAFVGCGKKADESKSLSEVKAEAETMSAERLRVMVTKYKDAIMAKKDEVGNLTSKLKDIPVTEMLGEEAKGLQTDIANLTQSVTALKKRLEVYYNKLKEKGGDISGLEI